MKLQKIILCVAVALTAFGVSLGLLELGSYLRAASRLPLSGVASRIPVFASPTIYPAQTTKPPAPTVPVLSVSVTKESDFDPTGYYYIVDDAPKDFADFEFIGINAGRVDNEGNYIPAIKPEGWLSMKDTFEFSRINITGKRLTFVTQTRKGISYQFDGKFIEDGEVIKYKLYNQEFTDPVALKGRLTKWRNGKKIAEAKLRFTYTEGC